MAFYPSSPPHYPASSEAVLPHLQTAEMLFPVCAVRYLPLLLSIQPAWLAVLPPLQFAVFSQLGELLLIFVQKNTEFAFSSLPASKALVKFSFANLFVASVSLFRFFLVRFDAKTSETNVFKTFYFRYDAKQILFIPHVQ